MNNAMCNHDKMADWIDAIPNGWQAWKLSHAFIAISSGTTPDSGNSKYYDGSINWINTSELREKVITETEQCVTEEALKQFSSLKIYKPPALLIAMYGATIGRLGLLGKDATVNQACCVLSKPKHLDVKFAFYWFLVNRNNIITLASGGGQPNINQEKIKQLRLSAPKCEVQQTIAQFLDHKTALIDQYIANKQRQLQLLNKLRTSIISEAVTQGLNPDVEMKDSGVKWLGKMPAHWQLKKIKYLSRFQGGGTPSKDNSNFWKGNIPWVSPKDMGSQAILDTEDKITEEAIRKSATKLIKAGTIVLVMRSGILRRAIPVAILSIDATLNQDMKAIISNEEIIPEYLLYLIHGNQFKLLTEWVKEGSTVESIEYKLFADTKFPLPPKDEQQAIIDFIKIELKRVDALINQLTRQITKMEDYRTSLISEAVTGKIDVRDFKLPATEVSA